jgi:hypothetical protein
MRRPSGRREDAVWRGAVDLFHVRNRQTGSSSSKEEVGLEEGDPGVHGSNTGLKRRRNSFSV